MLADMSLSNEAWAAINSIAVAITAIMAWLANRKGKAASAANSQAIAAVHEVARDLNPPQTAVVAAEKAVAALPVPSVNMDKYRKSGRVTSPSNTP